MRTVKAPVETVRSGVRPRPATEAQGTAGAPASPEERLIALVARSAGHASNRSIARLARDSSVRKLLRNAAGGGVGPGGAAPKDVAEVASDFLRERLGQNAVREGSDMENMLRKIARRNPGLAERATGLADQLRDAKVGAKAELENLT